MEQVAVFMTDKQIRYVKDYAALKKTSFNDALRQIIEGYQKYERQAEIDKAKEGFK